MDGGHRKVAIAENAEEQLKPSEVEQFSPLPQLRVKKKMRANRTRAALSGELAGRGNRSSSAGTASVSSGGAYSSTGDELPSRQVSSEDADARSTNAVSKVPPKVQKNMFAESKVVDDNPFFKGTSEEFKQEIVPFLVRHHLGDKGTLEKAGPNLGGLNRQGVFSGQDFDHRDNSQVRTLITQEADVPEVLDGLILTDARFDADLELIYNTFHVATVRANAALCAESLLGITQKPIFGVRLRTEPTCPIFICMREDIMDVLSDPCFEEDRKLLCERVQSNASSMMCDWYCQNLARVKIRLFTNVNATFKSRLIQSVEVRIHAGGSFILKQGETAPSGILVFHGDAKVVLDGHDVCQLTHNGKQASAWSGWWGLLEVTGVSVRRPANVLAVTDCTVWHLEGAVLSELREEFPTECSFFDKVAVKHVKQLSDYALDFFQVPLLKECDPTFLAHLSVVCTHRICLPGEYIIKEDDYGTEMFLLARGQANVYRADVKLARQGEGACFGELAVLGIASRRTASIICETVCDLRVLDRVNLLQALAQFPEESEKLGRVAAAHGHSRKLAITELENLKTLQGFSDEFVHALTELMHGQAFFLGQTLVKQDADSHEMYVIVTGTLALEVSGRQCAEVEGPAVICEAALLKPGSRAQATIRCLTVCECFAIRTTEVALRFWNEFPSDMAILKEMARARQDEMSAGLLKKFDDEEDPEHTGKKDAAPKLGGSGTFFADSDSAFLEQLSLQLEKCIFFDGQAMLQEGEAGDYALLINDGAGVVEVNGQRVAEIKRGDFVGEVVLLGFADTYSCTIRALGLVSAFSVKKMKFQEVIEQFPDEKKRLEALMTKRVNLTRSVTKIKAFCKFVGSSAKHSEHEPKPEHDDEKGHKRSSADTHHRNSAAGIAYHDSHAKTYGHRATISGLQQHHHHQQRGSIAHLALEQRRGSLELLLHHKETRAQIAALSHGASCVRSGKKHDHHDHHEHDHHEKPGHRKSVALPGGGDPFRVHPEHHDKYGHRKSFATHHSSLEHDTAHHHRGSVESHKSSHGHKVEGLPGALGDEEEGLSDSDESSKDSHPRKKVMSMKSGRSQGKLWVRKRREAIRRATWRQNMNLKRVGQMAEHLPPECSFRVPEAKPNLSQATSVYGRPVWHEVFGAGVQLPAISTG